MRTLDPAVATAIAGQEIWPVRMVSLQIGEMTYYVSDHYRDITYNTNTYLPNGTLLGVDNISDATTANHDSIEISLSAIDNTFRAAVLAETVIGGRVDLYRGLISPITGNLLADPLLLYEGIIFSSSLSEEYPTQLTDTIELTGFTATIEIRSSTFRLDETPGRFTNNESNMKVDPTDRAMEYVASLNGRNLRFGGPA